jgi:cytochrome P450
MASTVEPVHLDDAQLPWIDVTSAEYLTDPYSVLERVRRERGRLAQSQRGVEIFSYDLLAQIFNDQRFRPLSADDYGQGIGGVAAEFLEEGMTLNMEPSKHLRVRRAKAKAFTPKRLEAVRPEAVLFAERLVDGFADAGRCDVLHDFGHFFSIQVMAALIGVPQEDIPLFATATLDVALILAVPLEKYKDRLEAALITLRDYTERMLEARRAVPPSDRPEDFVTALVESQDAGDLSDKEVMWGIVDLLFAGHDTTRYQLANTIRALVENGLWEEVHRRPELIPATVEESLRLHTIIGYNARRTAEDVVLDGVLLPQGTLICLNSMASTHDPERFEDPYVFEIEREAKGRVPFGGGLHKCLGHALARLELEIAIDVFTTKLTDARIDPDVEIEWVPPSHGVFGPENMPLLFERRTS